jgi:hypothetical protein
MGYICIPCFFCYNGNTDMHVILRLASLAQDDVLMAIRIVIKKYAPN